MSTRETVIQPARAADLPAIVDFQLSVYPQLQADRAFAERFYHWKYFDLAGRDTGYPSVFIARQAEAVVGLMATLPFTLQYQKQHYPAGWVADWHLAAPVRGQGVGRSLLQTAIEALPVLGCINGSPDAQAIFRETGFRAWPCARSWSLVADPVAYHRPLLAGWKKLLLARALLAQRPRAEPRTTQPVHLGPALEPAAADFAAVGGTYNGLRREPGYLQWLGRCPMVDAFFHPVLLADQAVGYVYLMRSQDRHQRRRVRVVDLNIAPDAQPHLAGIWQAIIALVLEHLKPVDYLDTIAPPPHASVLEQLGFLPRNTRTFWLKTDRFAAGDEAEWFVSLIDKDNACRDSYLVP